MSDYDKGFHDGREQGRLEVMGTVDCLRAELKAGQHAEVTSEAHEQTLRKPLEELLYNLGWATDSNNPDGLIIRAQLTLLRRSILNAYKALGFTDEDLKGYLFK